MFLHRTKVHGYKSPQVVYFKGNTCPRCKSLFATEKSANDHYRRNLKRKFCAKPRGPDASNVPPRRVAQSPPKNRGKRGKGSSRSKRFLESLDSRLREIEGRNAAWLVPAEAQALVAAVEQAANHYESQNPGKGKPHPMGPRRVTDICSWFTERAFSDQSGQGGPAATDHHRETGQAPRHCEQAIDHQTEGDVGANAQNVHEPARSTRSGITFTRRSCMQERRRWTARRPEDHM